MLLCVKVKPNQRFDAIEKLSDDSGNGRAASWQIRLKAPAVDGKANDYLIRYLSDVLGIPKSSISLTRGHNARIKFLEIKGESELVLSKLELLTMNKSV